MGKDLIWHLLWSGLTMTHATCHFHNHLLDLIVVTLHETVANRHNRIMYKIMIPWHVLGPFTVITRLGFFLLTWRLMVACCVVILFTNTNVVTGDFPFIARSSQSWPQFSNYWQIFLDHRYINCMMWGIQRNGLCATSATGFWYHHFIKVYFWSILLPFLCHQ